MSKIVNCTVIILIGFFCSHGYSQKTSNYGSHESTLIHNEALVTINAVCALQELEHEMNKAKLKVLKNNC